MGGRRIILIDTPGFDDDVRSDVQILEDIATWVTEKGYLKQKLLDGLIFLHPVNLHRVGGAERRRTKLLQELLGSDAYSRIVIATTMWEDVKRETAQDRLDGRTTAGGVWHDMCSKGATLVEHQNNKASTHRIIQMLVKKADESGKIEPQFQTQLKEFQGHVVKTSAGKELQKQLQADIKLIKEQLAAHENERPQRRKGKEWKRWCKKKNMMEERLRLREQQLRKLGGMVVSSPMLPTYRSCAQLHHKTDSFACRFASNTFWRYCFEFDEI